MKDPDVFVIRARNGAARDQQISVPILRELNPIRLDIAFDRTLKGF
jgi:hypothetical protein